MKKLIFILIILMATGVVANTLEKASLSIDNAAEIIQEAYADIPIQFQFDPEIKIKLDSANNDLFIAKKHSEDKEYSRAIILSENAQGLALESMEHSEKLVAQVEKEITAKINLLKKKSNNDVSRDMIFDAENYFQQNNFYAGMKKIDEVEEYLASMKAETSQVKKAKIIKHWKRVKSKKKITSTDVKDIIDDSKSEIDVIRRIGLWSWIKANFILFILLVVGAGRVVVWITPTKKDDAWYNKYIIKKVKSIAGFILSKK